jgi:hypothetical protein
MLTTITNNNFLDERLNNWPWIGLEQVLLITSLDKQPQAKQLDHKGQQQLWVSQFTSEAK